MFNETLRKVVNNYFGSGTFKMLLVTVLPDEAAMDSWDFRDDVTNEVANGNGYTTGGATITCTVADDDDTNDDVEVSFGAGSWPTSTITARAAIIYKAIGSAATDELIDVIDFGGNVTSTADTFTATPSTPLKFQN